MTLQRWMPRIAVVALLFAVVSTYLMHSPRQPAPPLITPPSRTTPDAVAAAGILESAGENVAVGVPAPGLVTAVRVKVGDRVAAGAPLFELDSRELEASLVEAQAQVQVAQANEAQVRDQLQRLKAVKDPGAVSQEELRTKVHALQTAQASTASAAAKVKSLRLLMDRLSVRAPRAGEILQVNIRGGEYASASPSKPALVLGDTQTLQVRADVAEEDATRFHPGKPAKGYLRGASADPISLEFLRVEPYVIPKVSLTGQSGERADTRVLQVIYRVVPGQQKSLYVGQQIDVYIEGPAS